MDTSLTDMTSSRPYLLRAVYDWVVDNGFTPQVLVNAQADHVEVPRQYVNDGRIVLNVSSSAVRNLVMGNDTISFSARFAGTPFQVCVPVSAILAIVARENGAGMSFPEEEEAAGSSAARTPANPQSPDAIETPAETPARVSRLLRSVSSAPPETSSPEASSEDELPSDGNRSADGDSAEQSADGDRAEESNADPDDPSPPASPGSGPPKLRVIK